VINININEMVEVTLTDSGKFILGAAGMLDRCKDGVLKCQLWELMATFGSHLYVGCSVPFEGNLIRFPLGDGKEPAKEPPAFFVDDDGDRWHFVETTGGWFAVCRAEAYHVREKGPPALALRAYLDVRGVKWRKDGAS